jgi:hypothetical protein
MTEKPPINPYLILLSSLILPGSGHVWLGLAQRGLLFLFFIVILGWASAHIMPAHFSFFGRHIGGIFIYGISAIDAYKTARIRFAVWHHEKTSSH